MNLTSINEQNFNSIIDQDGGIILEILPDIICNVREGRGNTFDCWITNQKYNSTVVGSFKAKNLETIKIEAKSIIKTMN